MEDSSPNAIEEFIRQSEEFKLTTAYDQMPLHLKDFFNEELARFKFFLDNFLNE